MSKLDDLLHSYRGNTQFLDELKRGKFDAEKGDLILDAMQEFVDKVLKSNLEEKWEIVNFCEIFWQVGTTLVENEWNQEPDYDLEAFDHAISGIVAKLYPEEMNEK